MATKAEWFRYQSERSGPKRKKTPAKRLSRVEGETGTEPARNRSKHAARKALYALEVTLPGAKPSRKSTRRAANRQKNDAPARLRRAVSEGRPESRMGKVPRGRGAR
jgi:hypothetical protein